MQNFTLFRVRPINGLANLRRLITVYWADSFACSVDKLKYRYANS